jgi:TctA family transporter
MSSINKVEKKIVSLITAALVIIFMVPPITAAQICRVCKSSYKGIIIQVCPQVK